MARWNSMLRIDVTVQLRSGFYLVSLLLILFWFGLICLVGGGDGWDFGWLLIAFLVLS